MLTSVSNNLGHQCTFGNTSQAINKTGFVSKELIKLSEMCFSAKPMIGKDAAKAKRFTHMLEESKNPSAKYVYDEEGKWIGKNIFEDGWLKFKARFSKDYGRNTYSVTEFDKKGDVLTVLDYQG